MNNLFDPADTEGIVLRLKQLKPGAQRQWGKMSVNQMLAHCDASLKTAMGLTFTPRLGLIGRFFGRLMKPAYFSEKPFPKNATTDKTYIIAGQPDFEKERANLIAHINSFFTGGAAQCTTHPQAFFGELTPDEWAIMQWKHLDHHLRQFGA